MDHVATNHPLITLSTVLSAVFVMSFISATLVPIGSEPIMFGLLKVSPEIVLAHHFD
jgi:membrane protein YqaA with SNARE-associated domain